jgi:hypothetical protein
MNAKTKRGSESPYCQLNDNERAVEKPLSGLFFCPGEGDDGRREGENQTEIQKSEFRIRDSELPQWTHRGSEVCGTFFGFGS